MSKISEHYIGTANGTQNLIEWTAGAKHRYYPSFGTAEQLNYAKRIARVEDADARKLMLELLDTATRCANRIVEARKEFETINTALVKIDAQLSQENVRGDSGPKALESAPLLAVGLFVAVQFPACLMGVDAPLYGVGTVEPSSKLSLAASDPPSVKPIRGEDAGWPDSLVTEFAEEPITKRFYDVLDTISTGCLNHSELSVPLLLGTIKGPLVFSDRGSEYPRCDLSSDASNDDKASSNEGGYVFWTHSRIKIWITAFFAGVVVQLILNIFLR